jgi:Fe(3+) dicitrate transport protein
MKVLSFLAVMIGTVSGSLCQAAEETKILPEVTVRAERKGPFLPDVEGTQIHQGKKTTSTTLGDLPPIQNNNYRQAFSQMPGLLVSEQQTPGHANINYRGVGDPHETGFLLTMKDGIPILSDWFGYPTSYYVPPLEAVERVDLSRGGSALLYGPQPGPVLNYVTPMPPAEMTQSSSCGARISRRPGTSQRLHRSITRLRPSAQADRMKSSE